MWWPEHVPRQRGHAMREGLHGTGRIAKSVVGRLGAFADVLLPTNCPVCAAPTNARFALCLTCWQRVRFIERPWCERLGTPMPYDLGPGTLSAAAIAEPPLFARARSAVVYDGPIPDIVQSFKYSDRIDLAPLMARWMARSGHELLNEADVVIPVPLHWTRLFARRFNQAALLSRLLARQSGRSHRPLVLVRRKKTDQQVGLSRNARVDNVRAAFVVPDRYRDEIRGKRVLLIDDVFTTGATLEAATRAILKAGAGQVDVLTFARVVGDG